MSGDDNDDFAAHERQYAHAVTATFPVITEWQLRGLTAYRADPGSDLHVDDQDWPPMPVSQIAWLGLSVAADHLNAIRRHIEVKQLFPLSHLTLCRSALIGASQTAWVLAPDSRATRLARARTVAIYLYGKHLQYLHGLRDLKDTPHQNTNLVIEHVEQRHAELEAKRTAEGQKAVLIATDMIETAASEVLGRKILTKEAVLAWQAGSGAAHGLHWPLFGTHGMQQSAATGEDGLAEFQLGGTLSVIANPYVVAYTIAKRGWDLLHRRGSTN
jgi:hypothetical protein